MVKPEYHFYVYILASRSRQLYIGMTNGIAARVQKHREARPGTYTAQYKTHRLVYYEETQYVLNAIARETELKGWNRAKKVALIEKHSPTWEDLATGWFAHIEELKTR